jgi:pilus assembly protein FimV
MSKMLRILALACAVLICQSSVQAVGLGSATVRSHLNEPLEAVIPVTLSGTETLSNTEVGLASIDDFRRVGIEYSAAMGQLRFGLEQGDSGPIIRVASRQVIRDPYLTFLVEVKSPAGRVVRQYTLLIDPPPAVTELSRNRASQTTAPASQPEPVTRSADRASSSSQRRTSGASRSSGGSTPSDSYTVQAGDTLYEIANRMRPSGVDVNTMVAALYRNNPQAFYQANINSLSRGARLDMPSNSMLEGLSASEVNALIRQHNQAWRQGRLRAADRAPVVEGGARDAAAVGQNGDTARRSEPRLALVPPSGDSEGAGADADEVRQELVRTEEQLASAELEAEELRSRVDELESIADQQESVISLRDAELAQLRQQLAQMREQEQQADVDRMVESNQPESSANDSIFGSEPEPEVEQQPEPVGQTPADSVADDMMGQEQQSDAEDSRSVDTAAEQEPPAIEPRRREMPVTADPEGGMFSPMLLLGLGGVVLLLIVAAVAFIMLRRRSSESASAVSSMGDEHSSDLTSEAEAALLQAVADDPEDEQARLALLRFYFEADNAAAFVAAAEEMQQSIEDPDDSEHWQAALAMGQQIAPSEPMFGGDGSGGSAHEGFDDLDGDETVQDEPAFDDPNAFDEEFGGDLGNEDDDDDFNKAFERTDNLESLEQQLPSDSSDDEADWTSDEFAGADETTDEQQSFSPSSDTDVMETLGTDNDDDDDLDGLDFDLGATNDASGESLGSEPETTGNDNDLGDDLELDTDTMSASADGLGDDDDAFDLDDSISTDIDTMDDDDGDDLSFDLDADLDLDADSNSGEAESTTDLDAAADNTAGADDDEEAFDLDFDLGDEDLFAEGDAVTTKLSLAEAYIDEGQADDARGMLEEVLAEGNEEQKKQAQALLDKL